VFNHLMSETADFHANHFSGSLVSQTNKLMGGYIRAADTTVFQTYPMVAGIVIAAIVLAGRAPLYVGLLLLFSVIFIGVAFIVSQPVRKLGARHAAIESKQTGYLADAVSNALAIKSFARGYYERERFHGATTRTFDSMFAFARLHRKQMNAL
jgi:ATP-binding cassette subfamily B protein